MVQITREQCHEDSNSKTKLIIILLNLLVSLKCLEAKDKAKSISLRIKCFPICTRNNKRYLVLYIYIIAIIAVT